MRSFNILEMKRLRLDHKKKQMKGNSEERLCKNKRFLISLGKLKDI